MKYDFLYFTLHYKSSDSVSHHLDSQKVLISAIFKFQIITTSHILLQPDLYVHSQTNRLLSLTISQLHNVMPADSVSEDHHQGFLIRGKMFYHPSLFHMAPTYDRIVPLTIADVVRSKNVLQVYGVTGIAEYNQGYVIVNNYPIKELKIAGRLLSYAYNSYDVGNIKSPNNFYLLNLDDCSGDSLLMRVKILESKTTFSLRDLDEDLLVEVTGTVQYVHDFGKQVKGASARIIGSSTDLDVEIAWWSQVLHTRRYLKHPWRYHHPRREGNLGNEPEILDVEASFRESIVSYPNLTPHTATAFEELVSELPSDVTLLDSFTLDRSRLKNKAKQNQPEQRSPVEFIDLSVSDDEVNSEDSGYNDPDYTAATHPNLPIIKSFLLASLSQEYPQKHQDEDLNEDDNPTSPDSIIVIN